jgi:plasmid stabilization system protein ParE
VARRLGFAQAAVADLDGIGRWLTQPGAGAAARRRLVAIRRRIAGLRTRPCRYPFGEHAGVREAPGEGYRILYRVSPDTGRDASSGDVLVLRVFGPGQSRGVL